MRSYNVSRAANYRQQVYNVLTGQVSAAFDNGGTTIALGVFPGPMLVGNRKDPLPWNYQINVNRPHKGLRQNFDNLGRLSVDYNGYIGSQLESASSIYLALENNLYDRALGKLNDRVRGNLDLSIAAAELKKSGVSLRRQIEKYSTALRRFSNIPRATKTLAEEWLAFSYFWKPTLSDIYGAADESQNILFNGLKEFKVHRTSYIDSVTSVPASVLTDSSWTAKRVVLGKSAVKICVVLKFPDEAVLLNRWTSLNPASIAWELLPFSFVYDWFVDVGSYLRNLETGLLYTHSGWFKTGYVSKYSKVNIVETIDQQKFSPSLTTVKATGYRWETNFRRTILGAYPLPRFPSFKAELGWQRLLSAAALTRTVLMKDPKGPGANRVNPDIVLGSKFISPRGVYRP